MHGLQHKTGCACPVENATSGVELRFDRPPLRVAML